MVDEFGISEKQQIGERKNTKCMKFYRGDDSHKRRSQIMIDFEEENKHNKLYVGEQHFSIESIAEIHFFTDQLCIC